MATTFKSLTQTSCQFIQSEKRTGLIEVNNPELCKKLYFPLFNNAGMMSAITADFKGDLKRSQNEFMLNPMVTEDLYNSSYSRNFWVVPKSGKPWSLTGVSAEYAIKKSLNQYENTQVKVQPGAIEISKKNQDLGISGTYTAFVPATDDTVEILVFTIKNESDLDFECALVPAIPIYARSADNQRDHRQVTTMLNRIFETDGGIYVKPVMSFDERGHKKNDVAYTVLSFDEAGNSAKKAYKRLQDYIGDSGTLDAPAAIYNEFNPPQDVFTDGREAIGAFQFTDICIKKGETFSVIVINGITQNEADFSRWASLYRSLDRVWAALEQTKAFWQERIHNIALETGNLDLDNWFCWVTFQPMARKVYGCSFLPDFGYGRGGRGWRDLWQDCLALILTVPAETKELLYQNFAGIRADGSNATIIGRNPGEFIADRNNITRTWMDHGVWPLLSLNLYINQTGDLDMLLRKQTYFKDMQSHRSQEKDFQWNSEYGNQLKTELGNTYEGSLLEHLLIQNITQFFNVGEHNICKLEDADWNDGLDMAHERGESVAFHCMYMQNLNLLADYLDILKIQKGLISVSFLKELTILLDTFSSPIDYQSIAQKHALLKQYMDLVKHKISGEKIEIDLTQLAGDLRQKAEAMKKEVLNHEWVTTSAGDQYFNGYYNNDGQKVEGDHPKGVRMTLTGQVFPIMSGLANDDQIEHVFHAAQKYLKDQKFGGYRLNTNFGEMALNLGRAFSFSYGDKENGAFFSHMIVMFMNALYSRGHVQKGYEVFSSIYNMCMDYQTSKIIPHVPEYFDGEGRGAYLYLTGSASWMVLTILTQIFGVSAKLGDFYLFPKLVKAQFKEGQAAITASFNGIKIKVVYENKLFMDYDQYKICSVKINEQLLSDISVGDKSVVISKSLMMRYLRSDQVNIINIELG